MWSRYVKHGPAPFELDEEKALAYLERYYQEHPIQKDAECFYYGILAYEFSYAAPPERQRFYLQRAIEAFNAYDTQTGGTDWLPVMERSKDAKQLLEQPPASST